MRPIRIALHVIGFLAAILSLSNSFQRSAEIKVELNARGINIENRGNFDPMRLGAEQTSPTAETKSFQEKRPVAAEPSDDLRKEYAKAKMMNWVLAALLIVYLWSLGMISFATSPFWEDTSKLLTGFFVGSLTGFWG
jgi:hypothetical protein